MLSHVEVRLRSVSRLFLFYFNNITVFSYIAVFSLCILFIYLFFYINFI